MFMIGAGGKRYAVREELTTGGPSISVRDSDGTAREPDQMLDDYIGETNSWALVLWERSAVRLPERVSIDAVGIENTEDLVDDLMPNVRPVGKNHDARFSSGLEQGERYDVGILAGVIQDHVVTDSHNVPTQAEAR